MFNVIPLNQLPKSSSLYKKGDVFILFGELFGRGYANGLVQIAKDIGMRIIGVTVGRRNSDGILRKLTQEELQQSEENLGGTIINIPLMAGFDHDAPQGKPTPIEMLQDVKIDSWTSHTLDFELIEKCRKLGEERFIQNIKQVMTQIEQEIPEGSNVFFLHTMAGGVPMAKIMLAISNRVFKGRGKRYQPSVDYTKNSDIGKLVMMSFNEVTAMTFQHLLDASESIRNKVKSWNGQTRYAAYGYHGTEILIDQKYTWQTYTCYAQGYAKKKLEEISKQAWEKGIQSTVFNCPEILTNSSTIFAGVELSLFKLLEAFVKEKGGKWAKKQWQICQDKLKDDKTLEDILQEIEQYNNHPVVKTFRNFEKWPMDHTSELADIMLQTSENIIGYHKNKKDLITQHLSFLILEATGNLIFKEISNPSGPVLWLGHQIIAQELIQKQNEN